MSHTKLYMFDPMMSRLSRLASLARRDRKTRFSGGAFGYMWAYATPLVWIGFVVLFFRLLGRTPPIAARPEIFVATGILPYVMFRQTITSVMRTLIANRYMLYIQPIDRGEILLATSVLEFVNMALTSLLVFGGVILLSGAAIPAHILKVYLAMISAWSLGVGFGCLVASIGQWSDSFARAVPLALRPMFWISGIFYTATELPHSAQKMLWWNPLFHSIEGLREGFFLGYNSPMSDLWWPFLAAAGMYMISLPIGRFVERTRRARHKL